MERGYVALGWSLDLYRSHGLAPAGMGAGGHIRAVPGTSKLVNVGYRGRYMTFLADFGVFVRGTHGTFSAKNRWIRQRYMGGLDTPTGGVSLATHLPIQPPPRPPPGPA